MPYDLSKLLFAPGLLDPGVKPIELVDIDDEDNPLLEGLKLYYLFNESAGKVQNLVDSRYPLAPVNSVSRVVTDKGQAGRIEIGDNDAWRQNDGVTSFQDVVGSNGSNIGDHSILVKFRIDRDLNEERGCFYAGSDGGNCASMMIKANQKLYAVIGAWTGGILTAAEVLDDTWCTALYSYNSTTNNLELYSSWDRGYVSGSGGPVDISGNTNWDFGQSYNSASYGIGFEGEIALGIAWDRQVSAAEAWSVIDDPYQLLKPKSIWLPAGVAAGGPIEAAYSQELGKNISQVSIFTGFSSFSQTQGNNIAGTVNSIVEPVFSQPQGNSISEIADISTEAVLSQGLGKNITEIASSIVEPTFTQGVGKNILESAIYIGEPAFSQTQGMNISQLAGLLLDAVLTQGVGQNIAQVSDVSIEAAIPLTVGNSITSVVTGIMESSFTQGLEKNITEIAVKITTDSFTATCGLTLTPTATIEAAAVAGAIGIDIGALISQIAITDINANITLAEANSVAETIITSIEAGISQTLGIAIDQAFPTYALITPSVRHVIVTHRDQKIGITYELRNIGIFEENRSINILSENRVIDILKG